jgi:NTE family protein
MNAKQRLPKFGLALGSGASRGWSHIGVLKALLREGIEPDIVCGTSVGAMMGASYLAGNLEKLEEWVLGSTRTDVLKFFNIRFTQAGLVDVDRLNRFLHNYVAAEETLIENLPRQFAAIATDLDNGQEVWFREGGLANAVRASMALPGLFPAYRDQHRWLVDGGLVNPVPVSTCRALGADIVIAVNLNSDIVGKRSHRKPEAPAEPKPEPGDTRGVLQNLKQATKEYSSSFFANHEKQEDVPGSFFAITNSINIAQDRITRSRLAGDPAEVVLTPRLAHIGMLEFHRAPEAIAEGESCVHKALAEIHRLVGESR